MLHAQDMEEWRITQVVRSISPSQGRRESMKLGYNDFVVFLCNQKLCLFKIWFMLVDLVCYRRQWLADGLMMMARGIWLASVERCLPREKKERCLKWPDSMASSREDSNIALYQQVVCFSRAYARFIPKLDIALFFHQQPRNLQASQPLPIFLDSTGKLIGGDVWYEIPTTKKLGMHLVMYVGTIYQTESGPLSHFSQGVRFMFDTHRLKHSVFLPSNGL